MERDMLACGQDGLRLLCQLTILCRGPTMTKDEMKNVVYFIVKKKTNHHE